MQTIGAGDHFGRKKLEHEPADFAVARSVVRTIALRDDQANRLRDVLGSAGEIVSPRRTTSGQSARVSESA